MPMKWYGRKVKKQNKKAASKALWKFAEAVLTNANKKVPHDEGTLEASGTVRQGKLPNHQVSYSAALSERKTKYTMDFANGPLSYYVAYSTPYAIKLHEAAPGEYNFRNGRESQWLEKAHKEMAMDAESFVAKEMRKEL